MDDCGSTVLRLLVEAQGSAVRSTHTRLGDATATVAAANIAAVLRFLRDTPELTFEMLTDLTCVDRLHLDRTPSNRTELDGTELHREDRFEVVYHLYSVTHNHRVRIKARVGGAEPTIDSAAGLWPSANWMEREVWDLYGIRFAGHPDLRRLLLYEEFVGHPLRKDYPKTRRQPLVGPGSGRDGG